MFFLRQAVSMQIHRTMHRHTPLVRLVRNKSVSMQHGQVGGHINDATKHTHRSSEHALLTCTQCTNACSCPRRTCEHACNAIRICKYSHSVHFRSASSKFATCPRTKRGAISFPVMATRLCCEQLHNNAWSIDEGNCLGFSAPTKPQYYRQVECDITSQSTTSHTSKTNYDMDSHTYNQITSHSKQ